MGIQRVCLHSPLPTPTPPTVTAALPALLLLLLPLLLLLLILSLSQLSSHLPSFVLFICIKPLQPLLPQGMTAVSKRSSKLAPRATLPWAREQLLFVH